MSEIQREEAPHTWRIGFYQSMGRPKTSESYVLSWFLYACGLFIFSMQYDIWRVVIFWMNPNVKKSSMFFALIHYDLEYLAQGIRAVFSTRHTRFRIHTQLFKWNRIVEILECIDHCYCGKKSWKCLKKIKWRRYYSSTEMKLSDKQHRLTCKPLTDNAGLETAENH